MFLPKLIQADKQNKKFGYIIDFDGILQENWTKANLFTSNPWLPSSSANPTS